MTEAIETQGSTPAIAEEKLEKAPARRTLLDRALTDLHLRVCAVLTIGLFIMPADGLSGVEICMFKRSTNLPCPGCGLTRSGSNLVRGNLTRAFDYNPFGMIIIPVMIGMGLLGVIPPRWRYSNVRLRIARSTTYHRFLILFTVCFVLFGFIRSYFVFKGWDSFFSAIWLEAPR